MHQLRRWAKVPDAAATSPGHPPADGGCGLAGLREREPLVGPACRAGLSANVVCNLQSERMARPAGGTYGAKSLGGREFQINAIGPRFDLRS